MLFFLCPLCAVFRQMKRQAAAAHNDPQALRLCIHYFRYKHLHLRRNPLPLFRHTIQKARRGPRWIIKIYNHNSVLISSYSIFQNRSFYTPRKIFYKTSKTKMLPAENAGSTKSAESICGIYLYPFSAYTRRCLVLRTKKLFCGAPQKKLW